MKAANEKGFQRSVLDMATLFRWEHYHTWDSRKSNPGFPDLILARGEGETAQLIACELKMPGKEPTDAQKRWLQFYRDAYTPTYCWTPNDWVEIEQVLTTPPPRMPQLLQCQIVHRHHYQGLPTPAFDVYIVCEPTGKYPAGVNSSLVHCLECFPDTLARIKDWMKRLDVPVVEYPLPGVNPVPDKKRAPQPKKKPKPSGSGENPF